MNTQQPYTICPKCKGQNYSYAAFCMHCGSVIRQAAIVEKPNQGIIVALICIAVVFVALWVSAPSTTAPVQPQSTTSTVPPATPQLDDMSSRILSELKQYMLDNFGTPGYAASWYSLINSFEVGLSGEEYYVNVRTSIWDDSDAPTPTNGIFGAVRSFMYSSEGKKYPIGSITIYGKSSSGDRILRNG